MKHGSDEFEFPVGDTIIETLERAIAREKEVPATVMRVLTALKALNNELNETTFNEARQSVLDMSDAVNQHATLLDAMCSFGTAAFLVFLRKDVEESARIGGKLFAMATHQALLTEGLTGFLRETKILTSALNRTKKSGDNAASAGAN